MLDAKFALLWQGICNESVKFASFIYIAEKDSWILCPPAVACLKSMALPPCLQAQLLTFIESLEKGLLAHRYSVKAVCFLEVNDRMSCSILWNVKVPKRPLLIFPETGGGAAARECQGRTLRALGTAQRVIVWSPHLLRSGSAGRGAMRGLHSQQTVVLSFPTVLHVNQPRAVEAEVCGTSPFLE